MGDTLYYRNLDGNFSSGFKISYKVKNITGHPFFNYFAYTDFNEKKIEILFDESIDINPIKQSKQFRKIAKDISKEIYDKYYERSEFVYLNNTTDPCIDNAFNLAKMNFELKNLEKINEIFKILIENRPIDKIIKKLLTEYPEMADLKEIDFIYENIGLQSIKKLILSKIDIIPKSIGKLQNLEKLYIRHCTIKSIPESIGNLKMLKKLEIWSTQLESLPTSVSDIRTLIELKFGFNKLFKDSNNLIEALKNNNSLKNLYLPNCSIEIPPESIGDLAALEILDLSSNKITNLPKSVGNLKSLKKLKLDSNEIETIPESIIKLESLEDIDLRKNKIHIFLTEICELKYLKFIRIAGNKLETLPECITEMQALKEISLSGNPILKSDNENIQKLLERLKSYLVTDFWYS